MLTIVLVLNDHGYFQQRDRFASSAGSCSSIFYLIARYIDFSLDSLFSMNVINYFIKFTN
jgi:hypothetical protein